MYSGQAMSRAVPTADTVPTGGLLPGDSAVIHSTAASHTTVTDTVNGRNRRTCIGWTNFQLVSWVSASATQAAAVNHGPDPEEVQRRHDHVPLAGESVEPVIVGHLVGSRHPQCRHEQHERADVQRGAVRQHVELVQEDDRDDDAGDEVDDEVEGVAIDPRHVIAHAPNPCRGAVDAVEHHRDSQPEDRFARLLVGDGDDAEHSADRAAGSDAMNEPALGDGVTNCGCCRA